MRNRREWRRNEVISLLVDYLQLKRYIDADRKRAQGALTNAQNAERWAQESNDPDTIAGHMLTVNNERANQQRFLARAISADRRATRLYQKAWDIIRNNNFTYDQMMAEARSIKLPARYFASEHPRLDKRAEQADKFKKWNDAYKKAKAAGAPIPPPMTDEPKRKRGRPRKEK